MVNKTHVRHLVIFAVERRSTDQLLYQSNIHCGRPKAVDVSILSVLLNLKWMPEDGDLYTERQVRNNVETALLGYSLYQELS